MTTFKPVHMLLKLCLAFLTQSLFAQYPPHPLPQYPEEWTCQWITHPDIAPTAYNLIHFRNELEVEELPEQYIENLVTCLRF